MVRTVTILDIEESSRTEIYNEISEAFVLRCEHNMKTILLLKLRPNFKVTNCISTIDTFYQRKFGKTTTISSSIAVGLILLSVFPRTTADLLNEGFGKALDILAIKVRGGFVQGEDSTVETERLRQSESNDERRQDLARNTR